MRSSIWNTLLQGLLFCLSPRVIHRWKSVMFRVNTAVRFTHRLLVTKVWGKGRWSAHTGDGRPVIFRDRREPHLLKPQRERGDERHAESNTDWQAVANCSPNWTLRIGWFSGRPFDWLTCPPQGSDLGFKLIMEPNSCCYEPINKNHFYCSFFLSWTLWYAPLCALAGPLLPHIQTLRSCFKLLGTLIKQAKPLEHLSVQLMRFTTLKALTSYM